MECHNPLTHQRNSEFSIRLNAKKTKPGWKERDQETLYRMLFCGREKLGKKCSFLCSQRYTRKSFEWKSVPFSEGNEKFFCLIVVGMVATFCPDNSFSDFGTSSMIQSRLLRSNEVFWNLLFLSVTRSAYTLDCISNNEKTEGNLFIEQLFCLYTNHDAREYIGWIAKLIKPLLLWTMAQLCLISSEYFALHILKLLFIAIQHNQLNIVVLSIIRYMFT